MSSLMSRGMALSKHGIQYVLLRGFTYYNLIHPQNTTNEQKQTKQNITKLNNQNASKNNNTK